LAEDAKAPTRAAAEWAQANGKAREAEQSFAAGDMPGARRGWLAARDACARARQAAEKVARLKAEPEKEITNSIGMRLVLIPAGKSPMGSPNEEESHHANEGPQRPVEISKPFYLGKYEVSQAQYRKVLGKNPSYFSREGDGREKVKEFPDTDEFPVEQVSWDEAVEFCQKLSALPEETQAGRRYELPTEAQWEYACRAKMTRPFHFGYQLNGKQANCDGKIPYGTTEKGPCLERTCPVGSYAPNAWGLHDMHGNVWEWCSDWYDKDYYRSGENKDPQGPTQGDARVLRGGSWDYHAQFCRAAYRYWYGPTYRLKSVGFRVRLRLE
jgi:formylglycine-generating enzyme required for sulfatase activity